MNSWAKRTLAQQPPYFSANNYEKRWCYGLSGQLFPLWGRKPRQNISPSSWVPVVGFVSHMQESVQQVQSCQHGGSAHKHSLVWLHNPPSLCSGAPQQPGSVAENT